MTRPAVAVLALACLAAGNARAAPRAGTVRAADGVAIAYDVSGQGKVAVVLLHCWACDRSFWKDQVDPLARRHRVVAVDLAGHGASGTGRARWTVDGLGADVEVVVRALKLDRVVLVGHSLGGAVALSAARRMPGRVLGVVAVDALHDVEKGMPRETAERLAALYEEDFPRTASAMVHRMFPPSADPAVVEWVVARTSASPPGPAVALLRDWPELDLARWMEEAEVPVRAIQSGPPVSPPTRIGVNRRHGSYDASFMDGVGHYPMLERPGEFNRRLEAAVAELAAAGASRPRTTTR